MQLNGSGAGRGTGKGATPTITGDRHGSSVIYRSGPLVGVKNSPSAPPPTGREALCRRRRRSDALLVLLGGLICLVPALHLSWHAGHVPRPYRAPSGQAGHLGGAVQARLDGFARGTGAARAKATKGGRIKGAPAEGKAAEGATAKGATPGKATKGGRPTDRRSSGGQRRGNQPHPVAHLDCADHGGPHEREAVDEMVFWSDIPSDASYLSPMHPLNDPRTPDDVERFLTFEPDHGGWNNIRMAMETALVLSHAMGRTLVLPPEQTMYLLNKGGKAFGFSDFFHLDAIAIEHRGFQVITTAEFLARMGKTGRLRHKATGRVAYPPGNTTNYDGRAAQPLRNYLRTVGVMPGWDPWKCALAVPSSTESGAIKELKTTAKRIMDGSYGKPKPTLEEFNGRPTPVNASLAERMREMLADRDQLCIYDHALQKAPLIHLAVDGGSRLLTHFYAFVFFADWRQDLWSKRFVRDHLRYVDEIVCAAARVVQAVRQHARANKRHKDSQEMGTYDGKRFVRRHERPGIRLRSFPFLCQQCTSVAATFSTRRRSCQRKSCTS